MSMNVEDPIIRAMATTKSTVQALCRWLLDSPRRLMVARSSLKVMSLEKESMVAKSIFQGPLTRSAAGWWAFRRCWNVCNAGRNPTSLRSAICVDEPHDNCIGIVSICLAYNDAKASENQS